MCKFGRTGSNRLQPTFNLLVVFSYSFETNAAILTISYSEIPFLFPPYYLLYTMFSSTRSWAIPSHDTLPLNSKDRKLPSSERSCTCLAGLCCSRKHLCFRPVPTVLFQTFLWSLYCGKPALQANRLLTATQQSVHSLHLTTPNTHFRATISFPSKR